MKRFLAVCLLILASLMQGCVVIPHPPYLVQGRGEITRGDSSKIVPGETTREEILLRFGEPSASLDEGKVFIYAWIMNAGIWAVGAGYSGDAGEIRQKNLFLVEFDDNHFVKKHELNPGSSYMDTFGNRIDDWTAGEVSSFRQTEGEHRASQFPLPLDPSTASNDELLAALPPIPLPDPSLLIITDDRSLENPNHIGYLHIYEDPNREIVFSIEPTEWLKHTLSSYYEKSGIKQSTVTPPIQLKLHINALTLDTYLYFAKWQTQAELEIKIQVVQSASSEVLYSQDYQASSFEEEGGMFPKEELLLSAFNSALATCFEEIVKQWSKDPQLLNALGQ